MLRHLRLAAAVSGLALLAGCGDRPPGHTDIFGRMMEAAPAAQTMKRARATSPGADPYRAAYYKYSMEHAEYEFNVMEHYRSAVYHANNAMAAAGGAAPEPAPISSRQLPADKVDELTSARNRLVAALNAGGATRNPDAAGKAVARFNCWMEQQEENFQPRDIAYCKNQFFEALAAIETAAPGAPETIKIDADVLFDFDKAVIKPAFFPVLDRVAEILVKNTNIRVEVSGHTDTAGPAAYNQRLSERRAKAVADYLERKGVSRDRMTVRGYGETRLAVPTPDNTREPRNRRVEIRQR